MVFQFINWFVLDIDWFLTGFLWLQDGGTEAANGSNHPELDSFLTGLYWLLTEI